MYRIIIFLITFSVITACTYREVVQSPSERLQIFRSGEKIIGYGVDIGGGYALTATHVLTDCKKTTCTLQGQSIDDYMITTRGEVSSIGISSNIPTLSLRDAKIGEGIYYLRSQSGRLLRIDGSIVALDQPYYAYHENLSGAIYTGAIEISIPTQKGESGSPVWSSSGELIGVISASNPTTSTSYVVR